MKIPQRAYELALEGGYEDANSNDAERLLDPKFFQALGKAMGWKDYIGETDISCGFAGGFDFFSFEGAEWQLKMLEFTYHLAEGKDAESFFNDLLKDTK